MLRLRISTENRRIARLGRLRVGPPPITSFERRDGQTLHSQLAVLGVIANECNFSRLRQHGETGLHISWNRMEEMPICSAMAVECAEPNQGRLTQAITLSKIPAFPPVVLRVLDLLSNEHTPIADLVHEITSDATLSAQVLRLANSALFGFAAQIDTVQHAVTVLGLSRVQSLIMTVATSSYMRAAFRTEALRKCWRHTLACAVISREIACAGALPPDRAYTFGLLHDIGRLGLLVGYPEAYEAVLTVADRDGVSLLDLEKNRFGMDHCEAGRVLIEQWALPQEFCVVAGRHHDPPQGGPFDMLQIIHLSCRLADTLGYSVVVPLNPMEFKELEAMAPAGARERLPQTMEDLRDSVERCLGEEELAPEAPFAPTARSQRPSEPAPNEETDVETSRARATERHPLAWDIVVVLVTVATFIAVLLCLVYFGHA